MDLDPQTQEILLNLTVKMAESQAPLLLVESRSKWKEISGIVVGFKRALKKLQYITDRELLGTTEDQYNDLIKAHDYLLTIEIPSNVERLSYFPLDIRNSGSYTMGVGSTPWNEHNYDVYITMDTPQIFPYMIRILSNRG